MHCLIQYLNSARWLIPDKEMTLYVKEFCHDKIYIFLLSVIHDFVLVNVPFSCIALFKQNKDEQILITMFLFTDQCKKGTPTRVQVS